MYGDVIVPRDPESAVPDNGPEFAGRTLEAWAYAARVTLCFIRPGKPMENAYVESFNGKFRDECLNEHWSTGKRRVRRCCWELWLGPEESVQVGEYGDHDHASTCGSRMYVAVVNAR